MKRIIFITIFSLLMLTTVITIIPAHQAQAQAEIEVECGAIIEGEFGTNKEEHLYLLTMAPRESFTVSLEPVGDFLQTAIALYGPTEIKIGSNVNVDIYVSTSPNRQTA